MRRRTSSPSSRRSTPIRARRAPAPSPAATRRSSSPSASRPSSSARPAACRARPPAVTRACRPRRRPTRRAAASTSVSSRTATTSPTTPFNLEGIRALSFRVASGGAGGTIQLRLDAPDGPLVAETAPIAPTGGWQVWTDVELELPEPAGGHARAVRRLPRPRRRPDEPQLHRLRRQGRRDQRGADVTASADPDTGTAPLAVAFDGEATDPDAAAGDVLTYQWDFGVAGTTTDTSTEPDPTFTYENAGHVQGDPDGHRRDGPEGQRHGRGARHLGRRVPDGDAVGRVRRQRARHQPLDRSYAAATTSRSPTGSLTAADRQRLDLRRRHDRAQHHRAGHARRRAGR